MLPLSSVFKNSLAISVSPLLRSWHFLLPPLGVLRDFSCSVKSAAALMAGPSRAVIQTYKQLEYKFCQEFALAGSSSRGHKDLFIYFKPLRTWQPAVIWWLGDGKIHLICVRAEGLYQSGREERDACREELGMDYWSLLMGLNGCKTIVKQLLIHKFRILRMKSHFWEVSCRLQVKALSDSQVLSCTFRLVKVCHFGLWKLVVQPANHKRKINWVRWRCEFGLERHTHTHTEARYIWLLQWNMGVKTCCGITSVLVQILNCRLTAA